jgi:peptidyl-prolyl cis-trans isomerase C
MRNNLGRKNSTKIFIAVTAAAALIFLVSNYLVKRANEVVVAKINNQKIFKNEIEKKLRLAFEGQNFSENGQELKIPEVENLPREVIEILAKEIYLEKELTKKAKKSKVADDPEIKAQIEETQNRILRQAYIDSLVKAEITDQKISDKYIELSNELVGKKEYLVWHIVTKTKEDADKVLRSLKAKRAMRFSDAAKKYSIDQESAAKGGELGFILEDNMIKEIAEVVTKLKPGEISKPIQTKFGWHIVKFSESREAKAIPFESAKFNIKNQLIQNKINEINSDIIKGVNVQIIIRPKPAPEPKPVEAAPAAVPADESSANQTPMAANPENSIQLQPSESAKAEAANVRRGTKRAAPAANAEEQKTENNEESKPDEKVDNTTDEKPVAKKSKHRKRHR